MPILPVQIPPGVVRQSTPLASKGRYWEANLVRWRSGQLIPVGGWQRVTKTPLSSRIRTMWPWATNAGVDYMAMGGDSGLFVLDGSVYTDITPTSYTPPVDVVDGFGVWNYGAEDYGTPRSVPAPGIVQPFAWTMDNWGEELLAVSSSDGRLLRWKQGMTRAEPPGLVNITTLVLTSNVVSVTTAVNHAFFVGDQVKISGAGDPLLDGVYTVASAPLPNAFTYARTLSDRSATGGTARNAVEANNIATIVTPERHCVLLGYGGNRRRVAWSSREDFTNWNFADITNTAGYLDLDTQNRLITCAPVREGTLIWTDDECFLMRFIGQPYVYSIERVGTNCGLLAPRSFAHAAGRCIWLGRESFWIYDGGYVKPLSCDVADEIFDHIDPNAGPLWTHGSDNGVFPEVWFWYPTKGNVDPNRYVVFSYAENWWSMGAMRRTAFSGSGVFSKPLGAGGDGDASDNNVYQHETGFTAAGVSRVGKIFAETSALNVNGGATLMTMNQCIPDTGYADNSTSLTIFAGKTPEGGETTFGPYLQRADGYIDTRATGRDFRVRIQPTKDDDWTIGQMRFNVAARGAR